MKTQFTNRVSGPPRMQRGLTLIEIMTAMGVVVIVLSLGVPSFQTLIANNKITTTTNLFVATLSLARSEALKRSATVRVSQENNGTGEALLIELNNDGTDIRRVPLAPGMDVTWDTTPLSFIRTGFMNDNTWHLITVCDGRTGETGREITIGPAGRVSLAETTCS